MLVLWCWELRNWYSHCVSLVYVSELVELKIARSSLPTYFTIFIYRSLPLYLLLGYISSKLEDVIKGALLAVHFSSFFSEHLGSIFLNSPRLGLKGLFFFFFFFLRKNMYVFGLYFGVGHSWWVWLDLLIIYYYFILLQMQKYMIMGLPSFAFYMLTMLAMKRKKDLVQ